MPKLSRRQFLATGLGAAGALGAGGAITQAWTLLSREDLIPGAAPDLRLPPHAWHTTDDRLSFAAIGDNGTGGRQAMAVAEQMARTYRSEPFGHVLLLGDICYYGSVEDRFDDVFIRPMTPLIDAGVTFELTVGNHENGLYRGDPALAEVEAELARLGTPARHFTSSRGPVDFFFLDSSAPGAFTDTGEAQLAWLDDALAQATRPWRVVALHHPPYSSGRHGSTSRLRQTLEPVLRRHRVDLVLSGHDHHYERTVPIHGITYVISGAGSKTTKVRPTSITAVAASTLEFLKIDVDGDRLRGRAIRPGGTILDRFELRARSGR